MPDKKHAPTRDFNIAVWLGAILMMAAVVPIVISGGAEKADFAALYTGGKLFLEAPSKLYDLREQTRVQEEILPRKGLLIDAYPPFHALLFAPLAMFPYRTAYITWWVINVLLWALSQYLLGQAIGLSQPVRCPTLCLFFLPMWVALIQGQPSILMMCLYSLTLFLFMTGRNARAGLVLGLGLLKYPMVLPFALILVFAKKWRFIAGFAASLALLTVLSLVAVGPAGILEYFHLVLDMLKHPGVGAYSTVNETYMPTLKAFVNHILGGTVSRQWAVSFGTALSLCLLMLTAWSWRRSDQVQSANKAGLLFAAALATSILASPYLNYHDLTPVAIAAVVVLESPRWSERYLERAVLASAIVVLYVAPLYITLVEWKPVYLFAPILLAFSLATLALAAKGSVEERSSCRCNVPSGLVSPRADTLQQH